jgi:CRISPR system Cascade subunit CasE
MRWPRARTRPTRRRAPASIGDVSRAARCPASQADERPQRKPVVIERPVARITGTLQVETADAFAHLIARGIGRHRAFGFGMLLLRPAG